MPYSCAISTITNCASIPVDEWVDRAEGHALEAKNHPTGKQGGQADLKHYRVEPAIA